MTTELKKFAKLRNEGRGWCPRQPGAGASGRRLARQSVCLPDRLAAKIVMYKFSCFFISNPNSSMTSYKGIGGVFVSHTVQN